MQFFRIITTIIILSIFAITRPALSYELGTKYQTQESLEPDIWASIWLISTLSEENETVLVESTPRKKSGYLSFGFEGTDLFLPGGSHFQFLLDKFGVDDPALMELGVLVSAVEKLGWQSNSNIEVSRFESDFRSMQAQFGRYWVPLGCYKSFFDKEYAQLSGTPLKSTQADCAEEYFNAEVSRPSIPMTAIEHVLFEIENGKNVVFVDTREPSEFEERHIPGAITEWT